MERVRVEKFLLSCYCLNEAIKFPLFVDSPFHVIIIAYSHFEVVKDVCQADCKMHVCSVVAKFPYLVSKKRKEGEQVRRVAQFDWRIIERSIEKSLDSSFEAAGLTFTPLPVCNS